MPKVSALILLLAIIGLISCLSWTADMSRISLASREAAKSGQTEASAAGGRSRPFRVKQVRRPRVNIDIERLQIGLRRLQPEETFGLPGLMHAAALFGWDLPLPRQTEASGDKRFKDLILDDQLNRDYFGAPIFVETRNGLQNLVVEKDSQFYPERQAHWGQLLCELAKHGIPLDQQIGSRTVQDVLADAIANFNIAEPQNEWTCIALPLYLAPAKSFTNKYGETYDFDSIAASLMSRNLRGSELSCFGLHVLEALVTLIQVDQIHHVLGTECRTRVTTFLARNAAQLCTAQCEDGSWFVDWAETSPDATAKRNATLGGPEFQRKKRVHLTGHHLSWLLMLPEEITVNEDLFQRAADYLLEQLQVAADSEIKTAYCPFSHAAHVLRLLSSEDSAVHNAEAERERSD